MKYCELGQARILKRFCGEKIIPPVHHTIVSNSRRASQELQHRNSMVASENQKAERAILQ